MNTQAVADHHQPVKDVLQRVWVWRWTCPQAQTVFLVDYPELERVYQETREEVRAELDADADLAGPEAQIDLPYPGLGQRGGRYEREQPQMDLLLRCAPATQTRADAETGLEFASAARVLERLSWAWSHTGRPTGLGPQDYAAQKEWTVCRAFTWHFFANMQEMPGAPLFWRDMFKDQGPQVRKAAVQVLGILLLARRSGRNGFTLSGPQLASLLDVSEPSVWRALRLLERSGRLIRMRRYKPGRNGRPVALTANWYGFGPRALADLEAGERPPVVKRARLRLRRKHLRAEARRLAALPGVGGELLPGYEYPDLGTFLEFTLASYAAATRRDDDRWRAFCDGTPPDDFTTARLPSFVFAMGELDDATAEKLLDDDQVEQEPAGADGGASGGEDTHTEQEAASAGETIPADASGSASATKCPPELGPITMRPPIDRRTRAERLARLGDLAARRPWRARPTHETTQAPSPIPKSERHGPPGSVKTRERTGPPAPVSSQHRPPEPPLRSPPDDTGAPGWGKSPGDAPGNALAEPRKPAPESRPAVGRRERPAEVGLGSDLAAAIERARRAVLPA